ncbi:double-strand break repair protein AddB [Sphingomonas gilva]|uniref:Double-strand break repair protein AddB n=1 Tax=Sphingomonas gilva TaxID=2305907 RepID=A0A396RLP7_9SPHN|nr:double-strand break repair protein AddB [Sphingomonas gilva]RHW17260.1 double-strand break repair protein AddB [Sphingomonas gilva]
MADEGESREAALSLFTIPPHKAFADTLAQGLAARHGGDPLALARGLVLLPNNRAVRAVTDAFVRLSGGGLLLPRLVAIGDEELGEGAGLALDPADAAIPPAIEPMRRRMILARLIERARGVGADEAVRLAGDLARVIDQLTVEGVAPERLRALDIDPDLSAHWRTSLELLDIVLDHWPRILAAMGRIDLQDRRNRQLDRIAQGWRADPPSGFVVAAGIGNSAPAAARLLRVIAGLPRGQMVFAGLDLAMPDEEWQALGPHDPDPVTGFAGRSIETHPQFHLKLLLDRMGAGRGEVAPWRGGETSTPPARSRAVANALRPAAFTGKWIDEKTDRTLPGVSVAQFDTPAEEAQAIAIRLRGALETPGRTAALVTPDRDLARRVSAHLARWGVAIDDSAGQPLSQLASGTLLIALADAAAQRFAPVPLMALLKHPLVRAGEARLRWLDGARLLDLALRGPRPAAGLDGVATHLAASRWREAAKWWSEARALLANIEAICASPRSITEMIGALRDTADALSGGAVWANPQGRAAADALAAIEEAAPDGPPLIDPAALAPLLRSLLGEVAVRPPHGGHPRLAIYGLIEARLQRADLMILGGLNEGVWPGLPPPDPWLAPRIRAELGLPGLERRIGIEAHDFAMALGAEDVLVTRAARDASAPAVASRLWLRLQALVGDRLANDADLVALARAIDDGGVPSPAPRPRPSPPVAERAREISVTEVDRLKADPFAFYARRILGLHPLDPVDADPSAAWRGTAVHDILERWAKEDGCDPARLRPRAEAMFAEAQVHPMMRALWQPRLLLAIDWIAAQIAESDRTVIDAEVKGRIEIAGVTLTGKFDRIDRLPGGGLAIIDYKTGEPPSTKSVAAGYSLQLGLIGLIAERGGFPGIEGVAEAFEYWSLARNKEGGFGKIVSPNQGRGDIIPADRFVALAAHNFTDATGRWLTGGDAFTAKLHPEYAPYGDYDQLMRRDEWFGRG